MSSETLKKRERLRDDSLPDLGCERTRDKGDDHEAKTARLEEPSMEREALEQSGNKRCTKIHDTLRSDESTEFKARVESN